MTNNFNPKKSGAAERPQLSPEEYVAKKKAAKSKAKRAVRAVSLTDEQVDYWLRRFAKPEFFVRVNGKIICVPVEEPGI